MNCKGCDCWRMTHTTSAWKRGHSDTKNMNEPTTQGNGNAGQTSERSLLDRLLGLIDIRRRSAQRELKDAIENKQWSKVPGWDGIDIGLMMAETIVREENEKQWLDLPVANRRTK